MTTITTLDTLLDELPNCKKGKEYIALAKKLDLSINELEKYASWSPITYTRNCIVRTEKYELILLCWSEGQETPIHCHGGEECWVLILDGILKENRQEFDEKTLTMTVLNDMILEKGKLSYMNDDMGFHSLHNIGAGRAMSLHLYMNPIDKCRTWNETEKIFEEKTLSYHTCN